MSFELWVKFHELSVTFFMKYEFRFMSYISLDFLKNMILLFV